MFTMITSFQIWSFRMHADNTPRVCGGAGPLTIPPNATSYLNKPDSFTNNVSWATRQAAQRCPPICLITHSHPNSRNEIWFRSPTVGSHSFSCSWKPSKLRHKPSCDILSGHKEQNPIGPSNAHFQMSHYSGIALSVYRVSTHLAHPCP